ncbi:hypothetical protein Tco_0223356 [Tanacetum coccineum]
MTESPLVDSGFAVPVFSLGDDPIACLNKSMAFLTAVASSRVIVQQVQLRQGQSYSGTGYKSNATSSGGNNASGKARVVKCYNCQAWYKENAMLAEAQEAGQILDEEQLAFLADPRVLDGQAVQTIILDGQVVRMQKRFSWPTFPTMVLKKALSYQTSSRLSEDFGKRFSPQQEMDVEQAFWFRISNPTIEYSNQPPVKVEVPSELPKVTNGTEWRGHEDGKTVIIQMLTMPSPDRPTFNMEDAFSNYLPLASPDYIPTSPGKTYSSSSNSFGIVPLTLPTLSLFHDDPSMKALQAFYTEKSHIPPPIPKPQESFLLKEFMSPKKRGRSSSSSLPQAFEIGESS